MAKSPLHPGRYDPALSHPELHATSCGGCGSVFFPPITLGCEKCGALPDQLKNTSIAAKGLLHSIATVHMHAGKDIEAPFTIAEVQLDNGPLIRAMLSGPATAADIGSRVCAQWVSIGVSQASEEKIEPRFIIISGGDAA